jgi:hypothetical protein
MFLCGIGGLETQMRRDFRTRRRHTGFGYRILNAFENEALLGR